MKRIITLALLVLTGCTGQGTAPGSIGSSPTPTAQLLTGTETPQPSQQRFKLKLTLSAPEDLKVREGDGVMVGQILADRVRDRQRLEGQKRQLQLQIEKLQLPIVGAPPVRPIPEVAALPAPSFLEEVAAVEQMKLKAQATQRMKEAQQRKLDLLQSMPQNELPEAVIPHEQGLLEQRQREVDQANAEVDLSRARLAKAQEERQYQEYQHSLELSKRAIAIQQAELQRQEERQRQQEQERDQEFKTAQLQAQLQQLNTQLFTLSAIRSPYSGKVQRIKFEGQNDQNLTVELTLVITDRPSNPGANPNSTWQANRSGSRNQP
jgi:hypothetical protein